MPPIRDNILAVRDQIAEACRETGRSPNEVTLVAVSKQKPMSAILEAFEAGVADFGESYWQEAREKLDFAPPGLRWHFIGHLQTNKAKYVVEPFHLIHSVDSLELAQALSEKAQKRGARPRILMEVNISGESSKKGIAPDQALDLAGELLSLSGIELVGLMGIAPYDTDNNSARKPFSALKELFDALPVTSKQVLSMGMSNDYYAAVLEGSTMVRVGSAIFGSRER